MFSVTVPAKAGKYDYIDYIILTYLNYNIPA